MHYCHGIAGIVVFPICQKFIMYFEYIDILFCFSLFFSHPSYFDKKRFLTFLEDRSPPHQLPPSLLKTLAILPEVLYRFSVFSYLSVQTEC